MKLPVTATLLTKNSERYLPQVLDALADFDEVLLLDNGSTDQTLVIAARYANVSVREHPFTGFGEMKNLAADYARNGWIFNIDSDEILSDELRQSLRQINWDDTATVYTVSRLNHYRGRPIRGCGWYPDILPRLYHRSHTRFSDRNVHERIEIPSGSRVQALSGSLLHYTYENAAHMIAKMQHYTDLYAVAHRGRKKAGVAQAVLHGVAAFIKSYIFKQGFRYGADGWVICTANAIGSYYKYIKLKEANEKQTAG